MKQIFSAILFFISLNVFSQNDSVAYSRDFDFKEGVFLTIEQFKQNDPILKSAIISGVPKTELDFLSQVMEKKKLVYKDSAGKEQTIETRSVWGYCQNRTLFLNFNKGFNRMNVIGRLCHFTAIVRTTMSISDPIMGMSNSYDELRQFILDTESNKIIDFNVKNMEVLLSKDTELHKQFMALKKREKANSIFIYLRKYNEKHPLYLTENRS